MITALQKKYSIIEYSSTGYPRAFLWLLRKNPENGKVEYWDGSRTWRDASWSSTFNPKRICKQYHYDHLEECIECLEKLTEVSGMEAIEEQIAYNKSII